jgi:hypothetical protein
MYHVIVLYTLYLCDTKYDTYYLYILITYDACTVSDISIILVEMKSFCVCVRHFVQGTYYLYILLTYDACTVSNIGIILALRKAGHSSHRQNNLQLQTVRNNYHKRNLKRWNSSFEKNLNLYAGQPMDVDRNRMSAA